MNHPRPLNHTIHARDANKNICWPFSAARNISRAMYFYRFSKYDAE